MQLDIICDESVRLLRTEERSEAPAVNPKLRP